MWKLDNRGVIVLVSLLSGCVIFYTISGALIGILISLIFVIYTCIVLLSDDSLVTRHALILFNCMKEIGVNLCKLIERVSLETSGYVIELFESLKLFWRRHIVERMDRHRKNTYQLSSESFVDSSRNSGDSNALQGLSPIPKKINSRMSESENNIYRRRHSAAYESARAFDKVTSTPIPSWKYREIGNGDVKDSKTNRNSMKKSSFEHSNSLNTSRDHETVYSANEDSPWGTTISPKMRQRAGGVKTVQTIAGPLLASTRYNIDAKTYTDVTSPGLSSRLTKYATEANSKLMHQSQYGTGQFPRVNLNSSPTPLINSKTGKLRLPVTVRVAPPDTMYHSPPERQKILSDICQAESPKSTPSVAQVLREISLKRHASRDDITAELIKKQRTDGIYSDELENLEEMTQKRARDESSRSDEEISIDNTTSRPIKRTRKPSCYDIINSLSSSTNVSSGVKRKADISRSGTPEVGKHFKSFDSTQKTSESKINTDLQKIDKIDAKNSSITEINNSPRQVIDTISPPGILKSVIKESIPQKIKQIEEIFEDKKSPKVNVPVKLTDRLFMREEPQNIDKLKTLIDEHSSVTRKFSGSIGDEIKKSDILNMRQTSMKAKLKSMFDAISGKTASKIDPNVVIQAETVVPVASASSPSSLTTLSSTTSTTNINTSPISTSAITPIIGKSKAQVTPKKHVTWNLPDSSSTSSVSGTGLQQQTENLEKKVEETQKPVTLPTFNSPTSTPNFGLGFSTANTSNSNLGTTGSFSSTSTTTTTSLFNALQTSTLTASNATKTDVSTVVTSTPVTPRDTQAPLSSFGRSPASSATSPTTQTTMPMFSQAQTLGFQPASTASSTSASIPSLFGTSSQSSTLFAAATTVSSTLPMTSVAPSSTSNSMFPLKTAGMSTITPKSTGFNFGTAVSTHGTVLTTSTTSNTIPSGTGFAFGTNTTSTPFANPTTTSTSTTQSGFTFGTDAPKTVPTLPSSGFSFGGNATVTPTTTQPSSFSFGPSTNAKPAFSFGTATSQAPVSTTVLTFGTSSTSAFGTPSSSTRTLSSGVPTTCSAPPAFGTPSINTSIPAFGTPSTTAPIAFGTPTTAPPNFGTPSTTVSTAFGTPTTAPPAFGTPTTVPPAFGTPSITTPAPFVTQSTTSFGNTPASIFGAPTTQPPPPYKPNPSTPLSFGPPKTTAPPAFGTTTTTTSSLFNGASTSVVTTSSSIFSGGGIFGQAKPPPAFGATTTANNSGFGTGTNFGATLFGTQPTTTTGFGTNSTSTTSFGTANTPAPGFGAQTTQSFGNPTTTTTTFGTNSTASSFGTGTPQAFGSYNAGTNSLFNPSNPSFGATTTAPPAFATTTPSTSVFGATPSNNFGSPSTAPPAFGSTNSSFTGFGTSGNNAPFGSSAPSFGAASTSAPAFGGASGVSGGGFAFGGTPSTSTPAPPQQNSVFSFGAGGSSTGFQFNGTTPQAGGFNFSGSATPGTSGTPNFSSPSPAFGASSSTGTGGMFSIGSGSTAPRSRSARQGRKQR